MKSDVNLNIKLIVGGNAIHSRRFQMIDSENCSGACLTLASKGLHERLVQFKDIITSYWNAET